jgi:hypothetical protein
VCWICPVYYRNMMLLAGCQPARVKSGLPIKWQFWLAPSKFFLGSEGVLRFRSGGWSIFFRGGAPPPVFPLCPCWHYSIFITQLFLLFQRPAKVVHYSQCPDKVCLLSDLLIRLVGELFSWNGDIKRSGSLWRQTLPMVSTWKLNLTYKKRQLCSQSWEGSILHQAQGWLHNFILLGEEIPL